MFMAVYLFSLFAQSHFIAHVLNANIHHCFRSVIPVSLDEICQ